MNQTHQENTKKTEKQFVDILHESLVNHKIITNPRVIQCGTYYSKERGYFRYRIKCGNIKECPRCREKTLSFRRSQMLQRQEECINQGGSLFIITGTLKHKKTDLRYLQKKLRTLWENSRTRRVGGNSILKQPIQQGLYMRLLTRGNGITLMST